MDRPTALAFGVESEHYGMAWATCGDNNNHESDFTGPSLFSADLDIFAMETPGGLGSHLDMLHSTSFCKGIAHEAENIYWVFNGDRGAIDKYDFGHDHGPGNDDHADGKIYRYVNSMLAGADGVSSHVFYNHDDKHLYIADTGNKRIVKLDSQSGTMGSSFSGQEPVIERRRVNGAVLTDVVPPGVLESPSGLEIHDNLIYVTDVATSRFYAFDMAGQLVRTLDTGLPHGSLSGLVFGPDDKVYFADRLSSRIYRIDPK
jgi:DNA-binding beta-propeller fold protein YncE